MNKQIDVEYEGRSFVLTQEGPTKNIFNMAEILESLGKAVQMGDDMGVTNLSGRIDVNGNSFSFKEITSESAMDNYQATKLLTTFIDNLDPIGDTALSKTMSEKFGNLYTQIREKELTPEEGAKQMNDEIAKIRQHQNQEQQQRFFDAAQTWINKPNLTIVEACHGVAYDSYRLAHPEQPQVLAQLSYGTLYEKEYAPQIKARMVRSAKDLFVS
jgi:hypothetical protein